MKISQINMLNFKKLRKYKVKSMFLIVPITVLVCLSLLVSSLTMNFQSAADQSIFGTIAEQSRLIELKKDSGFTSMSGGLVRSITGGVDEKYTENDLATIKSIPNVETAAINSSIPISNILASELFEDKSFRIPSLIGIDSSLAGLYTSENFDYVENEPIPIIVNANTFAEVYEDWQGKDEIRVELNRTGGKESLNIQNSSPIKTKAITYEKNDLLGTGFTISFGGLDKIQTFNQTFDENGLIFKKKAEEELKEESEQRKDIISKYWDYDKISAPLTYTFKVVGVIEDSGNIDTYIPEDFAKKLMHDYIKNQLDARNDVAIDLDELGSTYTGINYDGVEIQSLGLIGGSVRIGGPGGPGSASGISQIQQQHNIPGLVIEIERSEQGFNPLTGSFGNVVGEYTDPDLYEKAPKSGNTILIKTGSVYDRAQVVKDLNDAGYAYQDLFKSDIFNEFQRTLNNLTVGLTISFVVLSVGIIIFTMGKFVSESKKEIGIMRAIGAKRSDIRNMFVSQALLYTLISYIFGTILGAGLTLLLAKPLANWFDSVMGKTIRESFNVVVEVDPNTFMNLNIQAFVIYSLALFLIALVISLIPATRASRISPVEAIRNE